MKDKLEILLQTSLICLIMLLVFAQGIKFSEFLKEADRPKLYKNQDVCEYEEGVDCYRAFMRGKS